jgi:hypothetical protein
MLPNWFNGTNIWLSLDCQPNVADNILILHMQALKGKETTI